ncbi:MAG: pyroglutamyl-peptidase I [Oscillospiraceae bacterium]|nr:pyroglutamyl-peptidase I [Oscillospiraceae bacterium]
MKRILVTGFDPFGGETVNPSWEAVKLLPGQIGSWEVHKLELPTVFSKAAERAIDAAEHLAVSAILCVGQASGRDALTPEMVAINLRHASIPDNQGQQPRDEAVVPGAPCGYFATLPVRKMAETIREAGLPARVSYSAGTFVCNDLFYTLRHHFDATDVRVCFFHVPFLPQQAKEGQPSLPLQDIVRGLELAISCI